MIPARRFGCEPDRSPAVCERDGAGTDAMDLNNVVFEQGRYGTRAVLMGPSSNDLVDTLVARRAVELELNSGRGWVGGSIEFVVGLPSLLALYIRDLTLSSVSPIHELHELRALDVGTYCRTPIDFTQFPKLEDCMLEWRRGAESVFQMSELKRLVINRYKGHSVDALGGLRCLRELGLLNAPVSTLDGLSELEDLRRLRLVRLRKLTSLTGLASLRNLEELEITSCPTIDDIAPIGRLAQLRRLSLNNLGRISSLRPVSRLRHLESVHFWESTDITDGDLGVLLTLPALRSVFFRERSHYTHRRSAFDQYGATLPRLPSVLDS